MKFVISSIDLVNQLQSLVRVVKTKNTLPALDNFLFELNEKELTITASDLETTLITVLELENAEGSGSIGIDARRLLNTVKDFNEPLTFNIDLGTLDVDIFSSKGKYRLVGIDSEEYPLVPEIDHENSITLTAESLMSAINATLFAAAIEDLRPAMTGIYFKFSDDCMVSAGTDSNKLVKYKRLDVKTQEEKIFILSPKPAALLKSLLPKDQTPVEIYIDNKSAKIKFSTITLVCKLLEGNYPNFESVIPKDLSNKILIDKNAFQSVVRRVSLYANQAVQAIRLDVRKEDIDISAQDLDFSISANESINCTFDGDELCIGFKAISLLEVLTNLTGNEIQIDLSETSRPVVLSPVEKENENEEVIMLLMPITV